jgi:hypothetical protein
LIFEAEDSDVRWEAKVLRFSVGDYMKIVTKIQAFFTVCFELILNRDQKEH